MPTRVERPIVYTRALLNDHRATLDPETLKFVEKKVKAREARLRRAAKKRLKVKLFGQPPTCVTPDIEEIKLLEIKLYKLMRTVKNPLRSKKVKKLKDEIVKATERCKTVTLDVPHWPSKSSDPVVERFIPDMSKIERLLEKQEKRRLRNMGW